MSSDVHGRQLRSKSSVIVKQAFEENNVTKVSYYQKVFDQYDLSLKAPLSNNQHVNISRNTKHAFFTINNQTVDVTLNDNILSWSSLSEKNYELTKEIFDSIDLHNVYAISKVYTPSFWVLNNQKTEANISVPTAPIITHPQMCGFQLHTYERIYDNILQEILIVFKSHLYDQLEEWYQSLSKLIYQYRPSRTILVICNPYSGSKTGRQIFNTKIRPMLERAQYEVLYSEINDFLPAIDVINSYQDDLYSLDGLIVVGGDGSVINVINSLIHSIAKEKNIKLNSENDLPSIPVPICVIPTGTTNILSHTIHGNTDHCTPIFHLIFNQRMQIDMSAVYDVDYNFVTANFNASANYAAHALRYFTRYRSLKPKKIIQKSFSKATLKKNLRPIEIEIRYISAEKKTSNTRCYESCPSCTRTSNEENDNQVKAFDDAHMKILNNRLNQDTNESVPNKKWKLLHDNYLHVAILTNANLWTFAPQGLSKFGHLADGLLDLVLITNTTRKNFIRYLKRNGNSKNQYDFPFTNIIQIKEIEIELKFSNEHIRKEIIYCNEQFDSSSTDDSSFEDNETKSSYTQKHSSYSLEPDVNQYYINYLNKRIKEQHNEHELNSSLINTYNLDLSYTDKNVCQTLTLNTNQNGSLYTSNIDNRDVLDKNMSQSNGKRLQAGKTLFNFLKSKSFSRKNERTFNTQQVSPHSSINNINEQQSNAINRLSNVKNDGIKTSTNKQCENKKQPCMWNLDFTPYNSPLIRIKCFHRFLSVFAVGLHPNTVMKEINYSCFNRIH